MALTQEWRKRIEAWREELKRHFYRELGPIRLKGFVSRDLISVQDAQRGKFRPMAPGTEWGEKWGYGWFAGSVVLPKAAKGRAVCADIRTGGESLIFVNGRAAGTWGAVPLARAGVPGARYEILVESYAGHGPVEATGMPVPPERLPIVDPYSRPAVGRSCFGIWEEDVYQLWVDVDTLMHLRDSLESHSLRVAEIDSGLRDFSICVDFEQPREKFLSTVAAARRRLNPLLKCRNGSTAPAMFAFGHAHLDVAWLWPFAEGRRKIARTFAAQLSLMERYPEYRFLQSQPHLYSVLKAEHPAIYARVKNAARKGKVIPEGGMWVEADTNVSGGESLIRQFLYGKAFLKEEFGVDSELLWLPDVFGYSGALPQIMKGCGIKYFATHKIFWIEQGENFPYNTFFWIGIDGTPILSHLFVDYNSEMDPTSIIDKWKNRAQKDGIDSQLLAFGWGDGGGGPTRDHLEHARRQRDLEGAPRVNMSSPVAFFKALEKAGPPDIRYVGELYYQMHRGTYTSQARTKRGNRKSEFALREAEMWSAAAAQKDGKYPAAELKEAWLGVLVNQFHDVLPGSSIGRVYEEAEPVYRRAVEAGDELARRSAGRLAEGSGSVAVFNSLSWDRTALVQLPAGVSRATDAKGRPAQVQKVGGRILAEARIPACGWTCLKPGGGKSRPAREPKVRAEKGLLENELLRVKINAAGEISGIYDKESGREILAGAGNHFEMYRDVPVSWDAWELDSTYRAAPVELTRRAKVEVAATGPLLGALRVTRRLNDSELTQEIRLARGARRIEFITVVDWRETHKLLKVAFPVDIHSHEALYEIQFGHIARPNHKSRPFDADRFEVCCHKWCALTEEGRGAAILNDCKYGANAEDNTLKLTLLKAAVAPDRNADKGRQEFTYAFYAWNGGLLESGLVREAYEINCPPLAVPGKAEETSLFRPSDPNVVIDAIKLAEDGSRDMIVRLYESKRTGTECTLLTSLGLQAAFEADMLERKVRRLPASRKGIPLSFRAFEIKTLRLKVRAT